MPNSTAKQAETVSTHPASAEDWWRGAVIYQVYPRSFADSNNDGIGDLSGLYEKLDYIASLGVDGIWISPFFKSPMKDFGYDVSDYCAVDGMFGSNEDFERVIDKAHGLGLKVLVDMVANHTSDQHAWFKDSIANPDGEHGDWYIWADADEDGNPPNNWVAVFGGAAWSFNEQRGQYYMHSFLPEQPDLNWRNPAVMEAIGNVMRFWLDRGVDGFRLDACHHMMKDPDMRDNPRIEKADAADDTHGMGRNDLPYEQFDHIHDMAHPDLIGIFEQMRHVLDEYDGRMIVGEVSGRKQLQLTADYTQGKTRLHTGYNFSLLGVGRESHFIHKTVSDLEDIINEGWPSWSFSNHDVARTSSRWGDGPHRAYAAKLATAVLCCLRGTVFIYQGEELGLPEAEIAFEDLQDPYGINNWPKFKGRDGCRTPMPWRHDAENGGFCTAKPWLPVPPEHKELAADLQEQDPDSVLNFTRAFLKWRHNHPALIDGDITLDEDAPASLLTFTRSKEQDRVLCVFNFGEDAVRYHIPEGAEIIDAAPCPSGTQGTAEEETIPPFGIRFYVLGS